MESYRGKKTKKIHIHQAGENCCSKKKEGGLCIKILVLCNQALLVSWKLTLWKTLISGKYGVEGIELLKGQKRVMLQLFEN